jgi:surface-anchored protein
MVLNGPGMTSVPLGVHVHANWAVSAEGVYRLQFTQTATLANGQRSSDTETVTIAVGDVDPASASRGTGCGVVSAAALASDDVASVADAELGIEAADEITSSRGGSSAREEAVGVSDPISAQQAGDPVPLLVAVLAGLLLLGAAGGIVLWFRRRGTPSP